MTLAEAARPIHLPGTTGHALLLIHGFTSTPASQAGWAEGVHRATGATVSVPLLPGHGTVWQDLHRVKWQEWEATILAAFDQLAANHKTVAVGGLSLGGLLALLVALRRPSVSSLILVNHLMWLQNPALPLAPILKHLVPSVPQIGGDIAQPGVVEITYDRSPTGGVDQFRQVINLVRPRLGDITVPTLIFKSRQDHVIPVVSATRTLEHLGSARKELVWLEKSYHVATQDYDLPLIIEGTVRWLRD